MAANISHSQKSFDNKAQAEFRNSLNMVRLQTKTLHAWLKKKKIVDQEKNQLPATNPML